MLRRRTVPFQAVLRCPLVAPSSSGPAVVPASSTARHPGVLRSRRRAPRTGCHPPRGSREVGAAPSRRRGAPRLRAAAEEGRRVPQRRRARVPHRLLSASSPDLRAAFGTHRGHHSSPDMLRDEASEQARLPRHGHDLELGPHEEVCAYSTPLCVHSLFPFSPFVAVVIIPFLLSPSTRCMQQSFHYTWEHTLQSFHYGWELLIALLSFLPPYPTYKVLPRDAPRRRQRAMDGHPVHLLRLLHVRRHAAVSQAVRDVALPSRLRPPRPPPCPRHGC